MNILWGNTDSKRKSSEDDIKVPDFPIDNIVVVLREIFSS